MILQATKKLLDFVGEKPEELDTQNNPLASWHGNIFNIGRRKCLLITHSNTVQCFFLWYYKKRPASIFGDGERQGCRTYASR